MESKCDKKNGLKTRSTHRSPDTQDRAGNQRSANGARVPGLAALLPPKEMRGSDWILPLIFGVSIVAPELPIVAPNCLGAGCRAVGAGGRAQDKLS